MQITEDEKIKAWKIIQSYCKQRRNVSDAISTDGGCAPASCILKRINKECFCYGDIDTQFYHSRTITDKEVCYAVKSLMSGCHQKFTNGRWKSCQCSVKDKAGGICPVRPGSLFLKFLETLPVYEKRPIEPLLHQIFHSCRKGRTICDMTKKK